MVKERLSKLQKWILGKCLKDLTIYRSEIREFFGKKFGEKPNWWRDYLFDYHKQGNVFFGKEGKDINDYEFFIGKNGIGEEFDGYRPKKEFCSTRSIEATISRSVKKLTEGGFLSQLNKYGEYRLTEVSFLKANKIAPSAKLLTFREYQQRLDNAGQEQQKHCKKLAGDIKNIMANTDKKRVKN